MRHLTVLAFLAVASLPACDSILGSTTCPDVVAPAIVVEVRDAVTNEPLGDGTVVTALRDSFEETLTWQGAAAWATERAGPGIYRVEIERAGYEPRSTDGVVVRRSPDACAQLETVTIKAALVPLT